MSYVYSFEAKIMKYGGGRYIIYPPKEYQEKLKKHHEKKNKSHNNHRVGVRFSKYQEISIVTKIHQILK